MTNGTPTRTNRRGGGGPAFLLALLLLGLAQASGCGSDGPDFRAACYRYCDKATDCTMANNAVCRTYCDQEADLRCRNAEAIANAANACSAMTCAQFASCEGTIPDCQ